MAQTLNANPQKGQGNLVAIIAMFLLFAMISFVTNLAAPIGTIWKNNYDWSGMLGNMMNFLAYLFMGIPAGKMIENIGYKKTSQWAMIVGVAGLALQLASGYFFTDTVLFNFEGQGITLNFIVYLTGAFVCGFSVCMLNTVVNPMLNLLGGGGKKGNQLVQMGGSLNSLAGTLTPMLVGAMIGTITPRTSITDVSTLLLIAIGVFVFTLVVISLMPIPEPSLRRADAPKVKLEHSPWSFRHTTLGVIGIFFYVGLEVGIPGVLIFYLADYKVSGLPVENAVAIAGSVAAIYWLLMLCGRLLSSIISGFVSSKAQLTVVTIVAIALVIAAIFIPATERIQMPCGTVTEGFTMVEVPMSALLLVLCGLCTSVMWGGIFNLAVEGLGKYTAQASGIFMMMVVGGGVMPFIQNWIADNAGYMTSYWLVVAMLGYLLFYALVGCKNVNTNIPVDDTTPDALNL